MSRPRPVYRDKTSMVTRRVHKRQMLLVGDEEVHQLLKFTLAYCAGKYRIALHCLLTEANHYHKVATDPNARLPDFYRDFHSQVARQLNQLYGEHDAFWSNKQTNVVGNESADDILERIQYAMGNPVADGIERQGKNHKGLRLRWPRAREVLKRPVGFYRSRDDRGPVPDEVVLEFVRPPGFDHLTDDELDELIENRILAYEKQQRDQRDAEGLPFRCDHTDELPDPRSFPKTPHRLFRLAPLIGAKLRVLRIKAIRRLKQFRHDHDDARRRYLAGEHDVACRVAGRRCRLPAP